MIKTIKILSTIIVATMVLSCLAVGISAADFRQGNNDISESYAGSTYYDRFRQVPITGDGPTDVIAVALSQIGYQEGDDESQFNGMNAGNDNFTEYNYNMGSYGSGYGGDYYWCASFVSFCLYQAQCHDQGKISDWCRKNKGVEGYVWREVSCSQWVTQLDLFGMFEDSIAYKGNYVPSYGDLIFFTSNQKTSSHIGIVLYTDGSKVYTIEGNTSSGSGLDSNGGGVYYKNYDLSSNYILGYGTLPYERDENVTKIDYSGNKPTTGLYVSATNKYIYLNQNVESYGNRGYDYLLPKYSMFEITEVVSNQLLKGIFTINGKRVEGYIKNNKDRIIQLSDNSNENISKENFKNSAIINANAVYNFKNMCVDAHFVNDVATNKNDLVVGNDSSFGINGWIGFTNEIESFGYSIGGLENMVFDNSFAADTEDVIKLDANGGEYGQRFHIVVNSSELSDGENDVTFLVKLKDGRICILDTVKIEKNSDITPPENSTDENTEETTEVTTEQTTEVTTEETAEQTTQENTEAPTEQITEVSSEETTSEISEGSSEVSSQTENIAEEMSSEEISTQTSEQNKKGCRGGCRSSLSAISVFAASCIAMALVKKKKED